MASRAQIAIEIFLLLVVVFALGWQACEMFGGNGGASSDSSAEQGKQDSH
jgi:hypothetical protein